MNDCLVEVRIRRRRCQVSRYRDSTSTLSSNRNASGISVKRDNVALYPLHCHLLVSETKVVVFQTISNKPSKSTKAVIDGNNHHSTQIVGDSVRPVQRHHARAVDPTSSMDKDHNREVPSHIPRWSEHVQEEAILALVIFRDIFPRRLWASWSDLCRLEGLLPR